jgi:transcriptional regulator with XRE-family HTH domain
LGYFQPRPYEGGVVKREAHDRRYLQAIDSLRAARKLARLSQVELAAKLGKRQQFVSKYESGERRLDFIEFVDLAKALGLSVDRVLRELGEPNGQE